MSGKRPKVVVLVDWFWPGYRAGGPIKSTHHLIRWLQPHCDFAVVTSDRDHLSTEAYKDIRANTWNTTPDGIRVYYAELSTFSMDKLRQCVEEEQPDFVLMNSMFSVPFTQWPLRLWAGKPGMRLLLAPRGMLAAGALSVKAFKKKLFLRYFKLKGWHRKATFLATGEHEAADIRRQLGAAVHTVTVPNLPDPQLPSWQRIHKPDGEAVLLSVARISPEKNNLWMLEQFARLSKPARLLMLGPEGNAEYAARCRQAMASLPAHLRVEMLGAQPPEVVRAQLAQAHYLLLPTLGENFGHAIIEALTLGRPVITSDRTPWRQLEASHAGWDVPLEEAAFLAVLERAVAMTDAEYQQWCEGARARAEAFLHDPALVKPYLELLLS